jgi:hypothetical protein
LKERLQHEAQQVLGTAQRSRQWILKNFGLSLDTFNMKQNSERNFSTASHIETDGETERIKQAS